MTVAMAMVWAAVAMTGGMLIAQWGMARLARMETPRRLAPLVTRHLPPPRALPLPVFASPASGTAGTVALPAMPAIPSEAQAGIVAARPFVLAGTGATDRGRALECLTAAIYYEAASESDDGQRAVAQVVLNRVRHPAFPATVCGVVYQGSERAGCRLQLACDGAMARVPSSSGWARAARDAAAALHGLVFAPVGLATHCHRMHRRPASSARW
ncbi:cell wall hydrolase [Sphingomonas sp. MMS24-JH45]